MTNYAGKMLALFLLAVYVILLNGPARAQEQEVTCSEVIAVVQKFLPQDVSLENATDVQIDSAIYRAVLSRPDIAERIVSCCCATRPDTAKVIVFAAVVALPDKRDAVVAAAQKEIPEEQARGIENTAQAAFVLASRTSSGENAAVRGFNRVYREWTPLTSQEDAPASPYKP